MKSTTCEFFRRIFFCFFFFLHLWFDGKYVFVCASYKRNHYVFAFTRCARTLAPSTYGVLNGVPDDRNCGSSHTITQPYDTHGIQMIYLRIHTSVPLRSPTYAENRIGCAAPWETAWAHLKVTTKAAHANFV